MYFFLSSSSFSQKSFYRTINSRFRCKMFFSATPFIMARKKNSGLSSIPTAADRYNYHPILFFEVKHKMLWKVLENIFFRLRMSCTVERITNSAVHWRENLITASKANQELYFQVQMFLREFVWKVILLWNWKSTELHPVPDVAMTAGGIKGPALHSHLFHLTLPPSSSPRRSILTLQGHRDSMRAGKWERGTTNVLYVIFSLQFLPARYYGNCELRRVED